MDSENKPSPTAEVDLDRGWCLCLSGGGFRATLFHLGVLQRLNELGVLSQLSTITSVSGGSILNGLLASRWSQLQVDQTGIYRNFLDVVAKPIREFCRHDLRTRLLLGVRLNPMNWPILLRDRFSVSANYLANQYEALYETRLGCLASSGPRFVFCATNVATGACWHFHGGPVARMGDFYTGYCDASDIRVSDAVAASSSFPPGFSALRLRLAEGTHFSREDPWGELRPNSMKRPAQTDGTRETILLTDGGVYDNLGVEPVWNRYKTLLVSDAGRPFENQEDSGQGIVARLKRASDISMEQVGAVRKRWLVEDLTRRRRNGAVWTIHSRLDDFPVESKYGYGRDVCGILKQVRTDLDAFSIAEAACLENHGYSLADAALRSRAPEMCCNFGQQFQWPHLDWLNEEAILVELSSSHRRKIFRDICRYLSLHS